jgi:hypothetical protein
MSEAENNYTFTDSFASKRPNFSRFPAIEKVAALAFSLYQRLLVVTRWGFPSDTLADSMGAKETHHAPLRDG